MSRALAGRSLLMHKKPKLEDRRTTRTDADYHSCEEFIATMRSLEPTEIKRLGVQGISLVLGTTMTPDDLIGEAIRVTADGERRWPKDVNIGAYLYMAMKSLASSLRRREARLIHVPVGGDKLGRGDRFAALADATDSPEMKAILADAEAKAFEALAGDELAGLLLLSRLEGQSPTEFCESNRLTSAEFEAVSKRLQRKLRSLRTGA